MEENFKYFTNSLNKYAEFSGKESRKSYWMFYLFYLVISIVLGFVSSWLSIIFALGMMVPSLSMGARRLHDTGRSGWWQLIALIPLIGIIVLIVFLAQPSKDSELTSEPSPQDAEPVEQ